MLWFTLRRLFQTALALLIMSFVVYGLIDLMPGDPIDIMTGGSPGMTPDVVANLRKLYGVDQPLVSRYWHWLSEALLGDLGFSRTHHQPVIEVLGPALLQTCKLMLTSFALSAILALLLGIASALKPGGFIDVAASIFAFTGISIPVFWLALLLIMIFAVRLHWLPASGMANVGDGSFVDQAKHLALPVLTLVLSFTGQFTRYLRAEMIETLRADFVRTARAKGAGMTRVILVHALPNALLPVVTVLALSFGTLFSGALVTETMFAQMGVGKAIFDAVESNDFNLALMGLLFAMLVTLLSNFFADLVYCWLDPRITLR